MYFNIIVLLALSGLLAYVGDILGRKIGKMRLTFSGMRPRTTAVVISILTGMLITVVTLAILTAVSEEARVALFKIDEIRRDRDELTKKLKETQTSFDSTRLEYERALSAIRDLNESKEKLKAEVASMEKTLDIKNRESVVFQPDSLIAFEVISAKSKTEEIEMQFIDLINKLKSLCENLGVTVRDSSVIWGQLREPLFGVLKNLTPNEELVVYIKTKQRVMKGENLGDVNVRSEKNRIIFKKGDLIKFDDVPKDQEEKEHIVIDGSKSRDSIKLELISYLDKVRRKAKNEGLIIEPFMMFDSINLHDIVNEIKKFNHKIKLYIEITEDVSIVGPFKFWIHYTEIN